MSYPFFAASLPTLRFDGEPTMTELEFREQCRSYLSSSDFKALGALCDGGETVNTFVCQWRDYDTQLRNAVARIRAARIGVDAVPWLRGNAEPSAEVHHAVAAAFEERDPLRREQAFERIRWDEAERLVGFDCFSAAVIFAYAIRLSILCKRTVRDTVQGVERLMSVTRDQPAPII